MIETKPLCASSENGRHVSFNERIDPIDFGGQRSRSQLRLNRCVLLHQTWQACLPW